MRPILSLLGGLTLCLPLAASAQDLVLAVNEGATYRVLDSEIQQKYRDVVQDLGRILGRKVNVVPVADYRTIAEGLGAARYDIAYIHPAHLALKGLASDGYKLVALTKGYTDYRAHFLVRADSPVRAVQDLKGKRIGAPTPDSITAVLTRTTIREALPEGSDKVAFSSTRYQDAIPFMVENGLVDVGVTGSDSVAKKWVASGGKVAFASKPVPVKMVLASGNLGEREIAALQDYFVSLENSEQGRSVLKAIGKEGFVPADTRQVAELNTWLSAGLKP